jgi:hypothetical protein
MGDITNLRVARQPPGTMANSVDKHEKPTFRKKFSRFIQACHVYTVDLVVYSVDMTATTAASG